ncbi:hypothetical protein [Synoicihabitans lomoniglobus]|uniref:Uncharacterized protein n=1 Tax=Synoicihabitans lomoniglobus TaxID=2909285 RepID=A0AAE9ZVU4_9BACT|nr:hypothetical protein [Opitutaceae bacterium LMO-M01]WED65131.1 hypothetical protein PXH66_22565 [Opitutaceae bacterium LMO-M01]
MPDPRLGVHAMVEGTDVIIASNDNWSTGSQAAELPALFAAVGAFPLPDTTSRDAALLAPIGGLATVHITSTQPDQSGVVLVEAYDTTDENTPRLINVSARNFAGTDAETLVAGFVIDGNTPKRLLIRGVGPTLASKFGLTGVLPDPQLEVHTRINDTDTVVATNDNWGTEPGVTDAAQLAGAFTLDADSNDAAIIATLPAGAYTVHVAGTNGGTGEALIEIYELP